MIPIHASALQLLATSQWSEIERSDIEAINRLLDYRGLVAGGINEE